MKISITITDTENGQVEVADERLPHSGENQQTVTTATVLADSMLALMRELGEVELKTEDDPVTATNQETEQDNSTAHQEGQP